MATTSQVKWLCRIIYTACVCNSCVESFCPMLLTTCVHGCTTCEACAGWYIKLVTRVNIWKSLKKVPANMRGRETPLWGKHLGRRVWTVSKSVPGNVSRQVPVRHHKRERGTASHPSMEDRMSYALEKTTGSTSVEGATSKVRQGTLQRVPGTG